MTQGQWLEGQIIVGNCGKGAREREEARTLLDYAGHRPTWCNVGLMSQAGHGPKSGSRHRCLITAKTEQHGPVLSKWDKGVYNAAPEGGPAKPFGLKSAFAEQCPLRSNQKKINAVSLNTGHGHLNLWIHQPNNQRCGIAQNNLIERVWSLNLGNM